MSKRINNFKIKHLYKRGFILPRTLISFFIIFFMIIIVLNAFKVISKYKIDNYEIQDEISTIQIMRLLTISNNIDVSSNRISFDLDNKTWNIELINNNVILQPGTQFIFIDVDNAWFNKENRFIYINFIRKNIEYKRLIGYV
ncbi:MAG: hypothetical protein WBH68_02960 [Erysipelotrichaceae bacterium]|nr:hypothetical protein [Bacillota bacterium]NLP21873.1 ComGF family competence protein [Erysipelotrichaceae bacterium]